MKCLAKPGAAFAATTLFAVLGMCVAPATASAADYQKTVTFTCPDLTYCVATFPAVPTGKTLRISYVSCYFMNSPGFNMTNSAIGIHPLTSGGVLQLPQVRHFLVWQPNPDKLFAGTTSMPVPVKVNAGKAPEVYAQIDGTTRFGYCAISGAMN